MVLPHLHDKIIKKCRTNVNMNNANFLLMDIVIFRNTYKNVIRIDHITK